MTEPPITRSYPIPNLNFRDFWDICCHFQAQFPENTYISYTINGMNSNIVVEECEVSLILQQLPKTKEKIREYIARFYTDTDDMGADDNSTEMVYRPNAVDQEPAGLHIRSTTATKLSIFQFEDLIYDNYDIADSPDSLVEFGKPCEIVCAVIDMRGFSSFCEQPNIESPYTCGLMTAFYHIVSQSIEKYPPELIKFAGDGVLAIWETTIEDRQIAIDLSVKGSMSLNSKWQVVRQSPHFSHGAPSDIGCGISFGLASKLSFDNDYLGRPINLASRLCGVCPGGQVFIDKSVPSIDEEIEKQETRVRIKSFGEYRCWRVQCD